MPASRRASSSARSFSLSRSSSSYYPKSSVDRFYAEFAERGVVVRVFVVVDYEVERVAGVDVERDRDVCLVRRCQQCALQRRAVVLDRPDDAVTRRLHDRIRETQLHLKADLACVRAPPTEDREMV